MGRRKACTRYFLLDETGVGKADRLVVTKTYEHAIWGAGGSLRLNNEGLKEEDH